MVTTEFVREKRLQLSDVMFRKCWELTEKCDDPSQFRNLCVSYGILTDKRLLEEGAPTQRIDINAGDSDAIERLRELLKDNEPKPSTETSDPTDD